MKCTGVGRFVKDPELRDVGDTQVCEFSLAVNEYRKVKGERKQYTNYFDFVIWAEAAKVIAQYCKKGDMIFVHATARQDKWVDKTTEQNRSKVIFRVDDFTLLSNRRPSEGEDEKYEPEEVTKEESSEGTPF